MIKKRKVITVSNQDNTTQQKETANSLNRNKIQINKKETSLTTKSTIQDKTSNNTNTRNLRRTHRGGTNRAPTESDVVRPAGFLCCTLG